MLASGPKDIAAELERNFDGMTVDDVALEALLTAREQLVKKLVGGMPHAHRDFW